MSERSEERGEQLQRIVDMITDAQKTSLSGRASDKTADPVGLSISQLIGASIVEALIDIAYLLDRPTAEIAMRQPKELPSLDATTLLGVPVREFPLPILRAWAADDRDTVMIWLDKYHDEREKAEAVARAAGPIGAPARTREFKSVSGSRRDFKPAERNLSPDIDDVDGRTPEEAAYSVAPGDEDKRILHPGMPLCQHDFKDRERVPALGLSGFRCSACSREWL